MIEYVEIRSASDREIIGIVDTAKSIIWRNVYYGVGDFEVYAPCNPENISLLRTGNYVTRFDNINVGLIEHVNVVYNEQDGRMLVASGRFAKALLERRIIYKMNGHKVSPTILKGNVEAAARSLVSANAIDCAFDSGRNMAELALGKYNGFAPVIVDDSGAAAEKQVTHDVLMTYTDELLQEYGMGAYCGLDSAGKLAYTVYVGADRSVQNAENQPVIFSQDFDNLFSSDYVSDISELKNTVLVGGEGEGEERFYAIIKSASVTGSNRRELWVDAGSIKRTYRDDKDVEQTLTDAQYDQQLKAHGMQEVTKYVEIEKFDGAIDTTDGSFQYGRDYFLGDIVTIQDVELGLYINPRILEITEVQDENGYQINAKYGQ